MLLCFIGAPGKTRKHREYQDEDENRGDRHCGCSARIGPDARRPEDGRGRAAGFHGVAVALRRSRTVLPGGNLGADGLVGTPADAAPCLESDGSDNDGLLQGGEIPVSPHSGTFSATYDTITKLFSFGFVYTGLTEEASNADADADAFADWHIHLGTPGINGLVLIAGGLLTPPPANSNPLFDSVLITAALTSVVGLTVADFEATLLAGGFYINIHSDAYTQGELRSQITLVPEPALLGLFGLGMLGAGLVKRRKV